MKHPMLASAASLLGIVLTPLLASQSKATSKPQRPDYEPERQARRWVTFLALDSRRAEAADALLKMGAKAVPPLVEALDDPPVAAAQTVAHILRVIGPESTSAKEKLTLLSHSDDSRIAYLARYALAGARPTGITLVADYGGKTVLELDKTGKVVRTLDGSRNPFDAERLPSGNYLICEYDDRKVVEMTEKGKVVWSFTKLGDPMKAQRLPNGNTLITDGGDRRLVEVNRAGKIVWMYDAAAPVDAERMANGNTLVLDDEAKRVIELTPKREIVWEFKHGQQARDADPLPNGNILIAVLRPGRVFEITRKGKVVWELKGLDRVRDADRLSNGHTLVAQFGEIAEYDTKGKKVWSAKVGHPMEVNRY